MSLEWHDLAYLFGNLFGKLPVPCHGHKERDIFVFTWGNKESVGCALIAWKSVVITDNRTNAVKPYYYFKDNYIEGIETLVRIVSSIDSLCKNRTLRNAIVH